MMNDKKIQSTAYKPASLPIPKPEPELAQHVIDYAVRPNTLRD